MERLIDLHTHTTASDGSMSSKDIVRHAKGMGLCAIAVTDHDTMEGIPEALEEGKSLGIEVIPGVEISASYKPEMHILGYFTEETYLNIKDVLVKLRKNRDERNPRIIARLNEMGFNITLEEAEKESGGNVLGRPHIARVLINKGYVKNMEEAFDKYLGSGKPAYFKKDKLTPEEGIQEITKAGGIPVLAHPIHLGLSFSQLDDLLAVLVPIGLRGMEAYYVDNTNDDTGKLLRLAIKYNMLVTGGSDFHGSFKPDIELGKGRGNLRVPFELLEKLRK